MIAAIACFPARQQTARPMAGCGSEPTVVGRTPAGIVVQVPTVSIGILEGAGTTLTDHRSFAVRRIEARPPQGLTSFGSLNQNSLRQGIPIMSTGPRGLHRLLKRAARAPRRRAGRTHARAGPARDTRRRAPAGLRVARLPARSRGGHHARRDDLKPQAWRPDRRGIT